MILVALGILALAVLFSLVEAIAEKDWPRESFKYVVFALIVLLMALR